MRGIEIKIEEEEEEKEEEEEEEEVVVEEEEEEEGVKSLSSNRNEMKTKQRSGRP